MSISDFNAYQIDALRTAALHENKELALAILGLGLTGEAGETVELIKKYIGHGHEIDKTELTKELGDVLWYIANIAAAFGIPLGTIAERNINKLKTRYPEGFNTNKSINRTS